MNKELNGIIIVNKEKNLTSRDVVNILNKSLKTKKIGHTGTLDPLASGVLVVCIGRYTKLVDKITSLEKEYIATIKLGIATDTLDITGKCILKNDNISVDNYTVNNILKSFIGSYEQEVPAYSAVRVNGKRLYQYARNGEEVTLPKRKVFIKDIELLECNNDRIKFRTVVSKGTYIRSLIKDICDKLNVLGTMESLIRTKQGNFTIDDSYTIEEINHNKYKLLSVSDIFAYEHYELTDDEYFKVKNGMPILLENLNEYLILTYQNKEVAIYKKEDNIYKSYFMIDIS